VAVLEVRMTTWSHKGRVLYSLESNGRMSRTDLLKRARLTARELDQTLEELTKDGAVKIEKGAGRRGTPKTWIAPVRQSPQP
jgi:DNA-binding HxlR family transcriptional regulator